MKDGCDIEPDCEVTITNDRPRRILMRQVSFILILGTALLAGCAGQPEEAQPEEIRVLSTGPLEDGLLPIIERYSAETGNTVTLETGTTPVVRERLESGDAFDVVIATQAVIDAAAERGQVDDSTTPVVGRVGVGVAVREGVEASVPGSADELRDLLLSAETVAYNLGSSGVYAQSMIESLGITADIADRTIRFDNGTQVMAYVREGQGRDMGLAPLTEIQANTAAGVRMIPLPEEVQNYTAYHAVVGTGAVDAASGFVEFLLTPESREVFTGTGVE
jgi:molybdate transport system substrate-binding protein